MKIQYACAILLAITSANPKAFAQGPPNQFETITLSEVFHSEGADVADIDGDGNNDVVSCPYWYAGPEFRDRHVYAEVKDYTIKGYSDHFFSFARDFNGDGHVDIFSIPMPGTAGIWHENPGENVKSAVWKVHQAIASVDNESPTFADITGDGVEELVCIHKGQYGYAQPTAEDPTAPWIFTAISENRGYGRFTHGLGVGDVNGDGKADLLEKDGWWQQADNPGKPFQFHAQKFASSGGSQMFAYDFDGDGDNDVLSVQNAHGYGLTWFERRGQGDEVLFIEHSILGSNAAENSYGLAISQMHAVALQDIDGDGVKDIVTGKRFWAHGGNDPGASELPVLYWLRTDRSEYGVDFQPHLIHERVGVGTQLTTADIDGNGHIDIVVGNKLGTFVMLNNGRVAAIPQPSSVALHTVGSDEFKKAIRTTEPLAPESEQETFVVPVGFEVQLVAAEPDIAKPMNLAFDTRGRMWVSSSVEYPVPAAEGEGRDTIKILEDIDGDGRAEKVTTFADNLNIPIGLYPYRDGVICYSIPNIWFLRDTDGDDRCDTREILYGPFDYSRDTHGMCNGFTRGFDGWMYACHGFNNRSRVAGKDGHEVAMNSGNTFRLRLDGSRIEHFTDGQVNPFGMAIASNGDLFTADCHTKPITLLMQGGVYEGFGKPHDGLGFVPNVMDHLHGSTAIGGIALYQDTQFPPAFQGNTFGGNVMTSRVNRNSLRINGSTVSAQEESDFLISGDPWFRPVDLQVGPDGALYVADFYNRIIGHYEVGLDHPGRDRHRGRIWRIVYNDPKKLRRDTPREPDSRPFFPADLQSVDQQIAQLESDSLTARLLALDQITDQFGSSAAPAIRGALSKSTNADATIQLLWALHRVNALEISDMKMAATNESPNVRNHAFQMVGASQEDGDEIVNLLCAGLKDTDRLVRRAASIASSDHRAFRLTMQLIVALKQAPAADVHLKHAIRMSLRDHLKDPGHFQSVADAVDPSDVGIIVDLCLGIKTDFAGEFLAANIATLGDLDRETLSTYLSFAARYASTEHLKSIAEMAQMRFADDPAFQETLIRSVRDGISQRGENVPAVITGWAGRLVRRHLEMSGGDNRLPSTSRAIQWTFQPYPGRPDGGNPWTLSTKRDSADGEKASKLHSSFPAGETKTGIYRSGSFALPKKFSFFVAGHDGFPDKPAQHLNFVRIRDASSQEILQTWSPPRNDTAQQITWQPAEPSGREVFVEIADGDTASAFAWIAVGRFSVPGLNPTHQVENYRKAASLIAEFQLIEFRGVAEHVLADPDASREIVSAFASALVALNPSSTRSAIAESVSISSVDRMLRKKLTSILLGSDADDVAQSIGKVTKLATAAEQLVIAGKLSSDHQGIDLLLTLIEAGQASPRLLIDPSVGNKMSNIATEDQLERKDRLIRGLPPEDESLIRAMNQRKAGYLAEGGAADAGLVLFTKHCAVCHQVAGKGVAVGPNLDGVGNRGLDRLIEDILTPNRNIDAAFRASVVLTEDGKVVSGLVKRTEGAVLVIVDQTGKEFNIPTDEISQQRVVGSSPMPANFHETLDERQTQDLLAYLLSLTH